MLFENCTDEEIRENIQRYIDFFSNGDKVIHSRHLSFDYCYNFFHSYFEGNKDMDVELACLQLGFFLASWGMYRGSSYLLKRSVQIFIPLIEWIKNNDTPKQLSKIDVDCYNVDVINEIIECKRTIIGKLKCNTRLL